MTDEQSSKSETAIHLSILLAVALGVGVYLISTTSIIAKDGVTFIKYAKGLETSPIETMKSNYQHPGYPFLISVAHKIAEAGHKGSSTQSWIYSAQAVTLISRLLAVVLLYFVGKKIVGERFSFWAILILILLPDVADYGSDATSDWPHLFFLSAGFSLLIWAATSAKWWLFGFAGLAAGMGYLIRPECVQVVVFGTLWLGLQVFYSRRTISKRKAVFAFALLLVGFLITAGPYMKLKGAVFPKKQLVQLVPHTQSSEVYEQRIQICSSSVYTASSVALDIVGALGKLVERVSETLMWFFVPALLIGAYKGFRKRNWREPEKFFVIALIALNVLIMILLHRKFGYMSRRHILPLVVFTIFYVPIGLEALAFWLDEKFSKKSNTDFWFVVLVVTGIAICTPKLLRPIRAEKQSYLEAARWLAKNTNEKDLIAVPDNRIGFYSGRQSVEYDDQAIPKEAKYVVKVFKNEKDVSSSEGMLQKKEVFSTEVKRRKVIIYSRLE